MGVVALHGVSVTHPDGTVALDQVDLVVEPGECVLLCGRSGCGKTTLTQCINGLIPHFEPGVTRTGTVQVAVTDVDRAEMYQLALRVGSVFQNPRSQFFNLTSDDELTFGLASAGAPLLHIQQRVETVVRDLRIAHLCHRGVTAMSSGEKQSLVFASVAVMDPDVYLLDEPTANLDAESMTILHDQIARLTSQGKTVIIAEHRLSFLVDLVDRAVYLDAGRVVAELSGAELRGLSVDRREAMGLRTLDPAESLAVGAVPVRPMAAPSATTTGLVVTDLTCTIRGRTVVGPIDLAAPRGEVLGIIGENGLGKTTLLRALAGLERRTAGVVALDGQPLRRRERRRTCDLVMQDVNHQLFSDSVQHECLLARSTASAEEVESVLSRLDLTAVRARHPMALSGGQKQRLAIACALLSGKQVLLLDEPTSGLDFDRMRTVASLLRELADQQLSIVVVTHDRELLDRACDTVYTLPRPSGGASRRDSGAGRPLHEAWAP
ncbi:MAG TPA: ABC transporter ATP-binding protein [Cellulomonas sp.]